MGYKRRLFHLLGGIFLCFYWAVPRPVFLLVFGAALVMVGILEVWRLRRWEINQWLFARFGAVAREEERHQVSGIFWMFLGAWMTVLIFRNNDIVAAALLYMVAGDAAAGWVGERAGIYPIPWNPRKTWEGFLTFWWVGSGLGLLFLPSSAAVLGAGAAALTESLPLPRSDNFWVPVLGGTALSVFLMVFR